MSSFNHPYGQSPPSSTGAVESVQGTPNTALTAFSPEDVRPAKSADSRPSSAPLSTNQQDPFVSAGPRSKADQKLSATASAFQPFSYSVGPSSTTQTSQVPAVAYGSTANLVPDTGATRCIKVTSIYHDTDVSSCVSLSLEKLEKTGHAITGTKDVQHCSNNTTYIRLSDINEAEKVYSTLKLDHPKCAVEYISSREYGAATTPNSQDPPTAHEGQVVLTASYPSNTALDRKEFEESLRELLSAEGELHAWQKLLATEAGTFKMVAEFANSALVPRAINRCNNKMIGVRLSFLPAITFINIIHSLSPSKSNPTIQILTSLQKLKIIGIILLQSQLLLAVLETQRN
ncbi:meiosis mei2 protein [Rutstroemia sp. NJR-2017a BBW]|nr:meiosis mei2 protein [Rutstroemia sp. NJR-2017a BBW]